jgi:hypothetical protein
MRDPDVAIPGAANATIVEEVVHSSAIGLAAFF